MGDNQFMQRAELAAATDPAMNPWHPMKDPVDLKHTQKAVEEAGEYISALARCSMQGIDEVHPVSGKSNRQWLMEEIADVRTTLKMVEERFKLERLTDREDSKRRQLTIWHAMA